MSIFGASFSEIKKTYDSFSTLNRSTALRVGEDFASGFKVAKAKVKDFGDATVKTMRQVRESSKKSSESALAAILDSINEDSASGKRNKNLINRWSEASSDDRIQLLETADKSMKDYLKTVDESGPTWDGFVKYQKLAAAQIEATGIKSKLAAVGLNIFKAAAGMLVTVVAQFAIQKLIEGFQYLINIEDELAQKADEAREQYKSTTEELNSQEEALKNVKSQLVALHSLESPTLADAEQTKELEAQNAELVAQIAYLKAKAEIEKDKADKADTKAWEEANDSGSFGDSYDKFGNKKKWWQVALDRHSANWNADLNQVQAAESAQKRLVELEEERKEIYADTNLSIEERTEKLKQNKQEQDEIRANLLAIAENWKDSTNPEAQAFYKGIVFSLSGATEKAAMLKSELKDLNVDQDSIDELEKLAVSANTPEGLKKFSEALKKAIPNEKDREAFLKLTGSVDGAAKAFAKVSVNGHASKEVLNGFTKTVDDILGTSKGLTKVFDDNGKALTDGLDDLFDEDGNVISENIDAMFAGASDTLKTNISTVLQQLHDGQIDVDNAKLAFAAAFELEAVQFKTQEVVKEFEDAFGGAVSGVDGLINSYEELDAALKEISKTYDLVNGAIEEQNKNGSISISTALNLAKSGAMYADVLEVTNNGIQIKTGASKKMVEAQINATKASLEQAKAEAQARLSFLNLAIGVGPVVQAFSSALIPAIGKAGGAALKLAAIWDAIKNKKSISEAIAAGKAQAKNFEDELNKGTEALSSNLTNSLKAQVVTTNNEIKSLENMQKMVSQLNYSNFQTEYGGKTSKTTPSSSDDPRLKAWNEMLAVKKHQLEMDQITEEQYYAWLEANYKKQLNNRKKYAEEWRKYEEEIYKWKKQKRLDDWNEAVDLKKHELEMGKIDEGEYYAWLAANYKKYLNDKTKYAEEWRKNEEAIHKFEEQQAKDSQDALEDLIDLRIDMLKQEKNNEKDVLKERQDNVKDFYDKQRDLLKEHYDQIDKEEERREKRKKVTDIQAELLELEADDSVEAQKRRLELEESLSDAKKDLNDFERDEELDKAEKMYDDLEEMQTQYYEKQIEAIEDYLDNAYELRQQAIKDLQNGNAQLYQEMIEYNRAYGDGIDRSITEKWEAAYEALNRYNSLLDDDYGMKLDNMTGYNKGKYETAAEREAREAQEAAAAAKKQATQKPTQKPAQKPAQKPKSGPNRGDKVTIKKSATHFSSQSGNAKMASHVPGGKYTVYQVKGNQVLIGVNGAYTGWVWKSDIQGYATGTPYAKGGIANIDEKGLELILGSPDKGRYKFLNDGDKVFNAKASEFLYKWANQPGEVLSSMIKSLSAASSVSIASPCNITVGDVVINGSADEKTVGELRRAHKQIVTDILNEFKKMKK